MAVYLALLIGPFIAIAITVPFVILQYKKTRVINVIRCANFYLMILFTLCAYFVTMLPFPTMEELEKIKGPYIQLIPFYCIYDFVINSGLVISDWKTVIPAFSGGIMIGIVFNILMLMPTGFFMKRLYEKLRIRDTILIGFMISLIFEFTQLSGLFRIYPHPYRVFDVDDLIQNTLGMVLGAQLTHVWRFFKAPSHIVVRHGGEVSFRRRLMADLIDQGIITAIMLVIVYLTKHNIEFFALHPIMSFPLYFELIMALNMILSFIVYATNGRSIGMALRGLRLRDARGNRLALWQCSLRAGIFAIFINLPLLIGWFIRLSQDRQMIFSVLCILMSTELVFSYVFFNLTLALHIVTHGEKLIYEKVSRTHLGIEAEGSIRNRQKVLYRNKLLPEKIDPAANAIYNLLRNEEPNEKTCLAMRFLVESTLVAWMENGLSGHIFTVQIDKRLSRRTLLICVHGKYVEVERKNLRNKEENFLDALATTGLSYDTYYTGGINVFAVEL